MHHSLHALAALALAWALQPSTPALSQQPDLSGLSAEEVLNLVRYSQALQNHSLVGSIRQDRHSEAFALTMQNNVIRFRFDNPAELIHLHLDDRGTQLRRVVPGGPADGAPIPTEELHLPVRGTDLNYEDISMRFLYWPNPQHNGEERLRTRPCWRIWCVNPRRGQQDQRDAYLGVQVWVDQLSGAMMRMDAYDSENRLAKRFEVLSGQKLSDGTWVLKQMRIESIDRESGKVSSRTYLDIDKPQ